MANVAKQIIGSFEDIGKDIAREAVKVPKDIAGKALESLGTSSGKKGQQSPIQAAQTSSKEAGPLEKLDQTKDQKARASMAREALSQLSGNRVKREPTVQERLEREKQEKNEKESKRAAVAQKMAPIVTGSSKPKGGSPYGVRQKRTATENKSTRSD